MAEPLRLYRWDDAPPDLRALADLGGGEGLLAVVPAAWLEEAVRLRLPEALYVLLDAAHPHGTACEQAWWGALTRVRRADGSLVVIARRP